MDVKTLCLGVLSRGEATGYEIRKQFEEGPFAHFCDAGFGSIYPSLRKLSQEGLIVGTAQQQEARPDKKVYRITPAGRQALYEALLRPPARDKLHSDFLFMMFFGHLLPPRHLDALITERLAWYRDQLERMAKCDGAHSEPGKRFVVGFGRAVYEASARYLDEHRHELIGAALRDYDAAE